MTQQSFLSASSIFAAVDRKFEDVPVPEWGGTVRIVQMNATDSMAFNTMQDTAANKQEGMFYMLIATAEDDKGNKLFTVEDLPALKLRSFQVVHRLQKVALRLNKLDAEGAAQAKNA